MIVFSVGDAHFGTEIVPSNSSENQWVADDCGVAAKILAKTIAQKVRFSTET